MLALLGHGMQRLTFTNPFLRYANEAVLPFYVMHQSVLLAIGFYVVKWPIPDLAKYIIIGVTSFAVIIGLYEFLIRRHNSLRFLFGMRPLPKQPAGAAVPGTTPEPAIGA
jgi:hypothetical protein